MLRGLALIVAHALEAGGGVAAAVIEVGAEELGLEAREILGLGAGGGRGLLGLEDEVGGGRVVDERVVLRAVEEVVGGGGGFVAAGESAEGKERGRSGEAGARRTSIVCEASLQAGRRIVFKLEGFLVGD